MDFQKVKKMMVSEEGRWLSLYRCPAGYLTIGIGHNIEQNGISPKVCDFIFQEDVQVHLEAAEKIFAGKFQTFSELRQMAFLNMVFQMGEFRFRKFKNMIQAAIDGRWEDCAAHALDSEWAKVQTPERAKRVARMIRENVYVYDQ